MPIGSAEIEQVHIETWGKVSSELRISRKKPRPYLWYGSPEEVYLGISREILQLTGKPIGEAFASGYFEMVAEKKRVGLTPTFYDSGRVILPGIILTTDWSQIISDPDRILLHENVNSALTRSSPMYIGGVGMENLFSEFGSIAFNVRDTLVNFTEAVGTDTTEILAKKFKTKGEYFEEREYAVHSSGRAKVPSGQDELRIEEMIKRTSPSETLFRLLKKGRYNPAKDADRLFIDWNQRIASKLPSFERESLMKMFKNLVRACNEFASASQVLVKTGDGSWVVNSREK